MKGGRSEPPTTDVRHLLAALAIATAALAGCGGDGWASVAERTTGQPAAVAAIRAAARPITGSPQDHQDILEAARPARWVLLGESTHGTHDFYRERARISERLIAEQGAQAIAIEGDWSATWRVNLYVRGLGGDRSAEEALGGFSDFPRWMWPNTAFRDLVERVRAINLARPPAQRVGIYGMDVYDLFDAADFVVAELRRVDPAAAARARGHYRCFARHRRSAAAYGQATRDRGGSCRGQAEAVAAEVARIPRPPGAEAAERHFGLVRSAASVAAAEEYFREASTGSESWNLRDTRMARTIEDIAAHGQALAGRRGKVIAWAHNSHVGDARATSVARSGQLNLGQLMRETHGTGVLLVGFFSASGNVLAAPEWDRAGRVYTIRPPAAASHEALFRATGIPAFSLVLRGNEAVSAALSPAMAQRAIGVIYDPRNEREAHYFTARLPQQFDAAVFFASSEAVRPLRR